VAHIPALEHPRGAARSTRVTIARDTIAMRRDDYPLLALASLAQVLHGETPEPWEILPDGR
jgi:hypothetical protein